MKGEFRASYFFQRGPSTAPVPPAMPCAPAALLECSQSLVLLDLQAGEPGFPQGRRGSNLPPCFCFGGCNPNPVFQGICWHWADPNYSNQLISAWVQGGFVGSPFPLSCSWTLHQDKKCLSWELVHLIKYLCTCPISA